MLHIFSGTAQRGLFYTYLGNKNAPTKIDKLGIYTAHIHFNTAKEKDEIYIGIVSIFQKFEREDNNIFQEFSRSHESWMKSLHGGQIQKRN